jgi:hypothetical protein
MEIEDNITIGSGRYPFKIGDYFIVDRGDYNDDMKFITDELLQKAIKKIGDKAKGYLSTYGKPVSFNLILRDFPDDKICVSVETKMLPIGWNEFIERRRRYTDTERKVHITSKWLESVGFKKSDNPNNTNTVVFKMDYITLIKGKKKGYHVGDTDYVIYYKKELLFLSNLYRSNKQ